jgi:acyl-CoA thioester hydrolase
MPSHSPSWPTQKTFHVTYHDLDVLNHLNHATYFVFMETLRCEYYLSRVGSLDPKALDIIIAEAACRYLAPAFYQTEILGEVVPALPLGRTSFVLLYRFTSPDRSLTYARGRTVVVTFDYQRSQKEEIPPDLRNQLEKEAIDPQTEGWTGPSLPS